MKREDDSRMKFCRRLFFITIAVTLGGFLFFIYVLNDIGVRTILVPPEFVVEEYMTATTRSHSAPPNSTGIDKHDYKYLIQEQNICQRKNATKVFLIIVVCIAPRNFEHRRTIRETWGSIAKTDPEVRLVFMHGMDDNETVQERLVKESKEFSDVIQEDFHDSYHNLSIKSVALLKWVSKFCAEAKFVLKADDDMYINVQYLINVLKQKGKTNSVTGFRIHGAVPIKDKNSKWYTPPTAYSQSVYPDYCSGTAYVLSSDIVPKLFIAATKVRLFWLEDIFITGICRLLISANIVNDWGFTYDKPNPDGCTFRKRITGHRYSLQEMRTIWRQINDLDIKC